MHKSIVMLDEQRRWSFDISGIVGSKDSQETGNNRESVDESWHIV
jgi:hypothetical protein